MKHTDFIVWSITPMMSAFAVVLASLTLSQTQLEASLVDVASFSVGIKMDIRYFQSNNFVGKRIDGYQAPKCLLLPEAANALVKAQKFALEKGFSLKVFDCYRPKKAVAHFMRWAQDLSDESSKAEYYPNLPKSELVGDYIAEKSGHSRGTTVDLTLVELVSGKALDMGGPFDLFDPISNTLNPEISETVKANRQQLVEIMHKAGFANYPMEWWHFSLTPDPNPQHYLSIDVR